MKTHPSLPRFSFFSPALARGLSLSLLGLLLSSFARAEPAAGGQPQAAPRQALIVNGDFETSTEEANWPDYWSHPKAGSSSWESEEGKHFLRINAMAPGEVVLIYRSITIPSGVKALELSLRARVIGLKCGPQPWFDARIMADFKNPSGVKLKGAKPISFRKDTDGWVERKVRFAVPDGAVAIEIMPTLFQTYSGTLDLDELQLTPIDPALLNPAPAAAPAPAAP